MKTVHGRKEKTMKKTGLLLLTLLFLALAGEPLLRKLDRVKIKYGILSDAE